MNVHRLECDEVNFTYFMLEVLCKTRRGMKNL